MTKTLELSTLRAAIRAETEAKIAELKQEEKRQLAFLDRTWTRAASQKQRQPPAPAAAPASVTDDSPQSVAQSNGDHPRGGFAMRATIKKLLAGMKGQETDQPRVYDALVAQYAEIRDRNERNVRAQISGVLVKLAKDDVISLKEKGSGKAPNVYVVN